MAGYSTRSLKDKLGIKDNFDIKLINTFPEYLKELSLPKTISINKKSKELDFIHIFTKAQKELLKHFPKLIASIKQNGMIWISWPKGKSGIETDLNENIIRDMGLSMGVVDVKVCAVDDKWSGLKFVIRLKDRK